MSSEEKISYVQKDNCELSISRQCELLNLARSSYYCAGKNKGQNFSEEEERAMLIMDKAHTQNSSYGARMHMKNLARYGIHLGRHKVRKLMLYMGLRSTAPQPKTSTKAKDHPKIPYLLHGKIITFPNQVWSTDITYIPLGRGHVYLSAIIDWYSRFIVGWRLHDTLSADEAVMCMNAAFERYGTPSICNSDQGSTYTSQIYMECLSARGVRQSMDGVRRWADNVLIERWFRNLKHECIYQTEYSNMGELRKIIASYVDKYNFDRLHSSLDYNYPAEWYFSGINADNAPEDFAVDAAA